MASLCSRSEGFWLNYLHLIFHIGKGLYIAFFVSPLTRRSGGDISRKQNSSWSNVAVKWFALLLRVPEALVSYLGVRVSYLFIMIFVGLLFLKKCRDGTSKIVYDCSLPQPCQFIVLKSPHILILPVEIRKIEKYTKFYINIPFLKLGQSLWWIRISKPESSKTALMDLK
jgi:hypothetical protein